MGVARAGWTAKRAAHVYTGKKNLKGRGATFSSGLPLPQETAHARTPRRSFRVGGGARSVCLWRESKAGQGAREVFNSPVMPHELQPVFLNLLPLASK